MMNTKRLIAALLCLLIPFVTTPVSAKDEGYKVIYDGGSLVYPKNLVAFARRDSPALTLTRRFASCGFCCPGCGLDGSLRPS